jgi:cyclopropane fatty-acyl-phospholipid synthase-like methyltransferase
MAKRDFDSLAGTWDQDAARAQMSSAIATAIADELDLTGNETVLDYGTGTGALALRLQPLVRHVFAADSSPKMLEVLAEKLRQAGIRNVTPVALDLEQDKTDALQFRPDIVVSAMALHHIADTAGFVANLHAWLPAGGRIALADLDTEAGDFHSDNTGVEHFGFDRNGLQQIFSEQGFHSIHFRTAYQLTRPTSTGMEKTYSIFLINAKTM